MINKEIKRLTLKNIPKRIESLKTDIRYIHCLSGNLDLKLPENEILHDKYVAELTDLEDRLANAVSAHRTLKNQEKRKEFHAVRYNTARETLILRVLERLDDSIQAIENKLEELRGSTNAYGKCIASEGFQYDLVNLKAKRKQLLGAS